MLLRIHQVFFFRSIQHKGMQLGDAFFTSADLHSAKVFLPPVLFPSFFFLITFQKYGSINKKVSQMIL